MWYCRNFCLRYGWDFCLWYGRSRNDLSRFWRYRLGNSSCYRGKRLCQRIEVGVWGSRYLHVDSNRRDSGLRSATVEKAMALAHGAWIAELGGKVLGEVVLSLDLLGRAGGSIREGVWVSGAESQVNSRYPGRRRCSRHGCGKNEWQV